MARWFAVGSASWTLLWSWVLFGGREFHGPYAVVLLPSVLSIVCIFVGTGRFGTAIRSTTAAVLLLWGLLLFAWTFLVSGALMMLSVVLGDASVPTVSSAPRSSSG